MGTLPKKKKGRILFFSTCVGQGGGVLSDGQTRKKSFSPASLRKARFRVLDPPEGQETARAFKLQIRPSEVARTKVTLALEQLQN